GLVVLGWVALGMYLAIFQGSWVWFTMKMGNPGKSLTAHPGPLPVKGRGGSDLGLFSSITQLCAASWGHRAVWALLVAAGWVATEMLQARFLSGFPRSE